MSKKPSTKIKVSELARRITGFSIPGFGLQWSPPDNERKTVRELLTFLEDRRVLYTPGNLEVAGEVEQSVLAIRQHCTQSLAELPEQSRAVSCVRMIRAACRTFLDQPRADFRNLYPRDFGLDRYGAGFFTALGELRARVGVQIAILAVRYEIELEAELASIVPLEDWEEIL
jgi:hypothetical protein